HGAHRHDGAGPHHPGGAGAGAGVGVGARVGFGLLCGAVVGAAACVRGDRPRFGESALLVGGVGLTGGVDRALSGGRSVDRVGFGLGGTAVVVASAVRGIGDHSGSGFLSSGEEEFRKGDAVAEYCAGHVLVPPVSRCVSSPSVWGPEVFSPVSADSVSSGPGAGVSPGSVAIGSGSGRSSWAPGSSATGFWEATASSTFSPSCAAAALARAVCLRAHMRSARGANAATRISTPIPLIRSACVPRPVAFTGICDSSELIGSPSALCRLTCKTVRPLIRADRGTYTVVLAPGSISNESVYSPTLRRSEFSEYTDNSTKTDSSSR